MRSFKRNSLFAALILIVLILIPFVCRDYLLLVFVMFMLFAIASFGLNLILGYTGLISLGHAAFYGISAYITGWFMLNMGLSYWVALAIGTVSAGFVAAVIGIPVLRLPGHYFAMVTLAFLIILETLALQLTGITGGSVGLIGIPPPSFLGHVLDSMSEIYYLILPGFVLSYFLTRNIVRSFLGRAFIVIRESDTAAASIGINVALYKNIAFTVGAMLAGLAGGLYVPVHCYLNPEVFSVLFTILLLVAVVVGGTGNLYGPIYGALFCSLMPELLLTRFIAYQPALFGLLVIIVLLYARSGIAGLLSWLASRGQPYLYNVRASMRKAGGRSGTT